MLRSSVGYFGLIISPCHPFSIVCAGTRFGLVADAVGAAGLAKESWWTVECRLLKGDIHDDTYSDLDLQLMYDDFIPTLYRSPAHLTNGCYVGRVCSCDEGEWLRKILLPEERVLEPRREVRLRLVPLAWRWEDGDLWDESLDDGLDLLHVFGVLEGFEALTITAPEMPADIVDDERVDPAPSADTADSFSFDSVLGGGASRAPRGGASRRAGVRGASRSDEAGVFC